MRMITPGMARSLTPTEFVERSRHRPRHRRLSAVGVRLAEVPAALGRLAHTVRHPRLRHIGH
jgi:hypothetical protein